MAPLCAEMLVLDSGSDDDTVAVARAHGARVEHQDWLGFAAQKNAAIARASQPWLLLLDADEWLAEGSADILRDLFASGRVEQADVWNLQRRNRFLGRWLHDREHAERLIRPDLRYLPMKVHERPDLRGKRVAACRAVIEHDTARSLHQHRQKLQRYAQLWAEQKHAGGHHCGPLSPWTHAGAYWLKAYLLRGAWRDRRAGWKFHACHAKAVVGKYRKLRAMNRTPNKRAA